jgi:predicted AAA+ superfamily ATPase
LDGKNIRKQLEVDFVCNIGYRRYYIQSAYSVADDDKREQELRPLRQINDSFQKIIIVWDNILRYQNCDS